MTQQDTAETPSDRSLPIEVKLNYYSEVREIPPLLGGASTIDKTETKGAHTVKNEWLMFGT